MSPRKPSTGAKSTQNNAISDKRTSSKSKSSKPIRKYMNRLLNVEISIRSEAMQIARRNANESPLLRLPAEIRTMIWQFALGYHRIKIYNPKILADGNFTLTYDVVDSVVKPTFSLPGVCRQIYVEAATMIYTLNTFDFPLRYILDRFIRDRVIGQRRLITSIHVPYDYFEYYRESRRRYFRHTFPNLKRIFVDDTLFLRSYCESWKRDPTWAMRSVHHLVNGKEGADLEILWL